MEQQICHDCGVMEGEIHEYGCDMENCPFCGGQLISCDCCYTKLGFNVDWKHPTCGLPLEIYENGLPDDLHDKWMKILNDRGRVPYIVYPNMCARCGELWPDMFMVPTEEWNYYIESSERDKMLCRKCYNEIKFLIDNAKNFEHLKKKEE